MPRAATPISPKVEAGDLATLDLEGGPATFEEANPATPAAPEAPKEDPFLGRNRGWTIPRAIEIMIHKSESNKMPAVVPITCGAKPTVHVVRGRRVIIPIEAFHILQSTLGPVAKCEMEVSPPRWYEEDETNYQWSEYGERTWAEYEAFLAEHRKRPWNQVTHRSLR